MDSEVQGSSNATSISRRVIFGTQKTEGAIHSDEHEHGEP